MCRKLMATDKRDNKKAVRSSNASSLETKKINQRSYLPETREGFTKGRVERLYPSK
jgi:hypothetical protein